MAPTAKSSKSGAERRAVKQQRHGQVLVAGGGIAGLYCAQLLADEGWTVKLLEAKQNWGGRIETGRLCDFQGTAFPTPAEFGPMRFELEISPLFGALLEQLGIHSVPFPPPNSPETPDHYHLTDNERDDTGNPLKAIELLKRGVFRMVGFHPTVDAKTVTLSADEKRRLLAWNDGDGSETQPNKDSFETLRRTATLSFDRKLHDVAFWNALQEFLSPGAVSAINQLGTFYHLMPDNPNAVEWAIFWLRLFRPGMSLSTIEGGVKTITEKLVTTLQSEKYKNQVELLNDRRITRLRAGKNHKVMVEYQAAGEVSGTHHVDHVILALPKGPLQKLATAFPDDIQKDLNSVVGFPLVKVFVVMRTPERWKFSPPQPQEQAGLLPTREVHYFVDPGSGNTMMLLYTDRPAAAFWKQYIKNVDKHHAAEIGDNQALERVLLQRLADLHFFWAEERLRTDAMGGKIRRSGKRFLGHSEATNEAAAALAKLRRVAIDEELSEHTTSLAALLRNAAITTSVEELRQCNKQRLIELRDRLDEPTKSLVDKLIEARLKFLAVEMLGDFERFGVELRGSLGAYAIRDWSKDTYIGAACHAWRPGIKSWEVRRRLKAFALRGRPTKKTLHICGEAYSDYQGFIEGALRSAQEAVKSVLNVK